MMAATDSRKKVMLNTTHTKKKKVTDKMTSCNIYTYGHLGEITAHLTGVRNVIQCLKSEEDIGMISISTHQLFFPLKH
jgi:hypothetical protein